MAGRVPMREGRDVVVLLPGSDVDVVVDPLFVVEAVEAGNELAVAIGGSVDDVDGDVVGGVDNPCR